MYDASILMYNEEHKLHLSAVKTCFFSDMIKDARKAEVVGFKPHLATVVINGVTCYVDAYIDGKYMEPEEFYSYLKKTIKELHIKYYNCEVFF